MFRLSSAINARGRDGVLSRAARFAVLGLVLALAVPVAAGTYNGTLKLGGIIIDEDDAGDFTAMQETYNLYDGFTVSRVYLNGLVNARNSFTIDLHEVNHDSRRGYFTYRRPGLLRLNARYDQHRQVYDAARATTSDRKDMRVGLDIAPLHWLNINADYGYTGRDGNRVGFPDSTESALGNSYDYNLQTAGIEAQVKQGPRHFAARFDYSGLSNNLDDTYDRQGFVVSGRVFTPNEYILQDKLSHTFRIAYGKHELPNVGGLDYEIGTVQYIGLLKPIERVGVRYHFLGNRVDNKSTDLVTDNYRHIADVFYYHQYGQVYGGYTWESLDDDRSVTTYNGFRIGATARYQNKVRAKVDYASREKTDEEKLTLLQDSEATRLRARLEVVPLDRLTLGGHYHDRTREYPDIGVKSDGISTGGFGRYTWNEWGSASADYTYYDNDYTNTGSTFTTAAHTVTGRVDFDRVQNLNVGGGVSYLRVKEGVDVEKTIFHADATYRVADNYRIEVKYNAYNYDDFIIVDRFYTANVVWINIAYDFNVER